MGTILGILKKKRNFFPFSQVFPNFDPPGCTGQNFYQKHDLETCSKHVWLLFGTFFGHFEKLKGFPVFWNFTKFRPSRVHWAIFPKKVTSKQFQQLVWALLGTFLDTSEFSIFFSIFFEFLHVLISRVHWSRKNRKKPPQIKSDTFRNVFGHFWKFKFFYISSRIFTSFDFQGALVIRNLEKNHLKTKLDTFGNVFGILKIWIFLHFLMFFDFSTLQGALKKKTSKKSLQNKFGHSWSQFWTFLKVWNFFDFRGFFWVSRVH